MNDGYRKGSFPMGSQMLHRTVWTFALKKATNLRLYCFSDGKTTRTRWPMRSGAAPDVRSMMTSTVRLSF